MNLSNVNIYFPNSVLEIPSTFDFSKEFLLVLYGTLSLECDSYGKITEISLGETLGEHLFILKEENPTIPYIQRLRVIEKSAILTMKVQDWVVFRDIITR